MAAATPIREGQVLAGPQFNERVRVETMRSSGNQVLEIGVVGLTSGIFRRVILRPEDLEALQIESSDRTFDGDPQLLRLGLQAYSLGIAYEFDPYFGLSISRVDPLPHQLEAVYEYLLKLPQVKFLLADDAGGGKTIMAGLLLRELKLRGLVERVLVVCPAKLAFQWQRELKEKFDETLFILRGSEIREQFGINQWLERPQIITSLDLAKRDDILPGLQQVHWDLVVVDEAHHMSADAHHKTERYRLGEILRDSSDHILLLTATPHRGDPENFSLFLQLLDPDAYADVRSIREAMRVRRAPFYLRRTKEAMVYFPERQPDGSWDARKIFTKRIPASVGFRLDGEEYELYRDVTRFVKRQSQRAAAGGEQAGLAPGVEPEASATPMAAGPARRAWAVGFLMAMYQRRLASSTYAVRRSLERRAGRLEEALQRAQELATLYPTRLPSPEDLEEMDDAERERIEEMLEGATLAQNVEEAREEIAELARLAAQAKRAEESGSEAKLSRLKTLLVEEGFFENVSERLLIFTEFKDTLDHLVTSLKAWGFRVGFIHGSMSPGSRDEPGTRLHAEQQFWEGATQVLVATEAAGEGINLQCCHVMFNYDIPWNPNRLEQRMGRIHRYLQKKDCLIFNFVATNTIEGSILQKLLEKLQEIRDALDDDSVFNVVGSEILPPAQIERVLRDYYSGRLGDADLEERILRDVQEDRFRAICQSALEGLASKKLNLELLIERRARAQEHRVVPETVARFMREVAPHVPLTLREVAALPHTFDPQGATPGVLRRYQRDADWRLPPVASRYPRLSTHRETAEEHNLEWVTPGHPLFEAMRRHTLHLAEGAFGSGACFYSLAHQDAARIDFYRASVVDGLGTVVHTRLFAVEIGEGEEPRLREPTVLGDFTPAPLDGPLPPVAAHAESDAYLHEAALDPFLHEVRAERIAELDRVASHVELSLTELMQRADEQVGRFADAVQRGDEGARGLLAQAETRHQDLLQRRERRRAELQRQRALTLQGVERIATALVLPHPEREQPEVRRLRPDPEVEAIAMQVSMEHERAQGRQVFDVHTQNLGYDVTSLDLTTGELRLIEVKGLGASSGAVLLTPNERRVAEDRRDCYWLYVVTNCHAEPRLEDPIPDPARLPWHEVSKVDHYYLDVNAMTQPMELREDEAEYEPGGSVP